MHAGNERDMDFAFLFSTFAEASAEAGSEVAGAWRRVRAQQERGLGGRVIDLVKREQEMQQVSLKRKPVEPTAPPSFAQKLRSLKVVQPQPTSKYSPLAQANEEFGPLLFDVMLNASTVRPGPRDSTAEVRDAVRPLVVSLLSSTETPTLARVRSTWAEYTKPTLKVKPRTFMTSLQWRWLVFSLRIKHPVVRCKLCNG